MKRRFDPRTARGLTTVAVLALVLAGCSDGGDGDGDASDVPPLGGGGGGGDAEVADNPSDDEPAGLAGLTGAGQPADGTVAPNPFQTGGGTRPAADDDEDDGGFEGDDDDLDDDDDDPGDDDGGPAPTGGGGGNLGNPFGGGGTADLDDDDEPAAPVGGAVLGRVQNGFDGEDLEDLWLCEAPQVDGVQAVGYVFIENQGVLVVAPDDGGDVGIVTFSVSESTPGTLVNTYVEVDVVESMTDFRFAGEDEFSARSDLLGSVGCQRFFNDESGGGGGGGGDDRPGDGSAVAGRLQNDLTAGGQLATAWLCQGPQASADALLYAFIDGQGVFAALTQGQDPSIQQFAYAENSPGTLELAYENGDAERLDGFAFASAGEYSMTSSFDGPLTCQLAEVSDG